MPNDKVARRIPSRGNRISNKHHISINMLFECLWSDKFDVKVGLRQGSALSQFLFVVVTEVESECVGR